MALIAPFALVTRSTPYYGDDQMPVTERYRGPGLHERELRQAGDVVDLDWPPFVIDRVEDAVASGPQAPQIWRPVAAALRDRRPVNRPPGWLRYETETASVRPAVPAAVLSTPTRLLARDSSRPATLTRTHRTASHRSATCLVACPVLPEGPEVPG